MKKCKITDVDKALEIINEIDEIEGVLLLYPLNMNLIVGYSKEEVEGENDPTIYLTRTCVLYREAIESREMFKGLISELVIESSKGKANKALKEIVERM